ncbi:Gfo/Idh/MocA family oxidoreductase [Streptomyces sp. SJL17-1]|uniref:Gfo/Idh/MocA family protein n=1 Tax=Streptomyces sp. SJL17-1 TaxID=2967223 RepID=UPI00296721FC|nr:Gfo/Idh/MocA family oxidoreductase [Streptomyces sp. SJL17-1]
MSVRVAVVGLGWAGRELWLPRLREHPAFDVVAVVDPSAASRAAYEQTGTQDGAARDGTQDEAQDGARVARPAVLADVDELDRHSVDLAVVAVPNHLHAEVAVALLERGIPAFVEKPVCLNSAEAEKLAQAETDGGAVLLAGSASRYRGDIGVLLDLVPSLGTVRHVELAWTRARGVPKSGGWFTSRSQAGGGVLLDLGWHLLDTLDAILGPVPMVQVTGTVSDDFLNDPSWGAVWRQDGPQADQLRGDVEDTARGFLVSEHGTSVALRASWASHAARDLTLIRVEGSAGTATLRCVFGFSPNREPVPTLTLTREGRTEDVALPTEPIGVEYGRQLDDLPRLLGDPTHRGRAVADIRRNIRITERFYESALAGSAPLPETSAAPSPEPSLEPSPLLPLGMS